jgi:site-specific recombinase XerD
MNELQIAVPATGPNLSSLLAKASQFMEAAKSAATRKSYKSDARSWEAFCAANALPFLPSSPEVVALYISDLASRGIAVATIRRKLAAITDLHRSAGYADSSATPRRHYV